MTPIAPDQYQRFPWKNGGGVTVDIAEAREAGSLPGSWQGLIWRLGRTSIAAPGPFSDLSGFDRQQVVVAGRGLVLVGAEREIDLRAPFYPVAYPGEERLVSRLEHGPVAVVNLITAREKASATLSVLQDGESLTLCAPLVVVYAPAGPVTVAWRGGRRDMAHDHALRLDNAAGALSAHGGVALIAQIMPREA